MPVRDDLLFRRLSAEERRGVAEELRYPGYEVHHGLRPMLLPIVNRGFIDSEELSDFPLEELEFKPPFEKVISPSF